MASIPTIDDIKVILIEAWNRAPRKQPLTLEDLGDDVALFDFDDSGRTSLDLDSLDALEVSSMLEDRYDVFVPFDIDMERISTPRAIHEFLLELLKEKSR